MALVALLVGSRLADSSARAVAEFIIETLEDDGHTAILADPSPLSPDAVIDGDTAVQSVEEFVAVVQTADAVIISSPTIRGAPVGLTTSLLQLLPEAGLEGIPVAIVHTGDEPTCIDERHSDLGDLARSLGGRIQGAVVHVSGFDITRHACAVALDEQAEALIYAAVRDLIGAGTASNDGSEAREQQITTIDPLVVEERLRHGSILIDVRSSPTQGAGLIQGAVHVQKADVATTFGGHHDSPALIALDRPIIVVCNSERGSSGPARQLRALGYRDVSQVRGGADALVSARISIAGPSAANYE